MHPQTDRNPAADTPCCAKGNAPIQVLLESVFLPFKDRLLAFSAVMPYTGFAGQSPAERKCKHMFDTQKIGKKIALLRKQNNMTHFELADRLAISFQAVSNWERGNSMPDISKLPELAQILHTTVDDLLCTENPAVHDIMEGRTVDPRRYPPESISEAAQILKPDEVSSAFALPENKGTMESEENSGEGDHDANADQNSAGSDPDDDEDFGSMLALLPFLSEEEADRLADRILAAGAKPSAVLPFISEEKADELALHYTDEKHLSSFFPFMTDEGVDRLALRYAQEGTVMPEMLPFLSEEGLEKAAKVLIAAKGLSAIRVMYPFLSEKAMQKIFKDLK